MGNRALRAAAKVALKKAKQPYKNRLSILDSYMLRRVISDWSVKPGEIIHDCDGFNHIVAKVKSEYPNLYPSILFEDGGFRCQCSSVMSAASVEDITAYWNKWASAPDNPWFINYQVWARLGKKVCDDNGLCLWRHIPPA